MTQVSKFGLTTALALTMTAFPLTITTVDHGFVTLSVPTAWAKDGESGGNSGPGGGGDDGDGGNSGSGGGGDDSDGGNSGPGGGGDDSDGGNSGPGGGGDDSDGGNSGPGGGGDDSDGGNSGRGGDGDDSDGGNSGRGGGGDDNDGDNSGPGGGDDDRDSARSDKSNDDGRRGRKGRGSDDEPNHHEHEVTFADGSKIEIENGRFERKNAAGRTVEERPATPRDFETLANARSTQATAPRGNSGRARGGGTVASFEIHGQNIEVNYVDGWKEEIENGRYEMKDANNNTVVERAATRRDRNRLFGAFE